MVEARAEFRRLRKQLPIEKLVFIDESGCHPGIGPLRGWAPKGTPLFGPEQVYARKQHVSIIGAIGLHRTIARATVRGGGAQEQDRPSTHRRSWRHHPLSSAISPGPQPDRGRVGKLKHLVRKLAARTIPRLRSAIYRAWARLSAHNIRGWFRYCGCST